MKIRYQKPTFVSMWMLDVFCCALGCVTLLWLLKTREAGHALAETASVRSDLKDARLQLTDATMETFTLSAQLDEHARELALVREERDKIARRLALAERQAEAIAAELLQAKIKIDDARKAMAALEERATKGEDELARRNAALESLTKKADTLQKSAAELEALLRNKEKERTGLAAKLDDLSRDMARASRQADQLAKAENRVKQLEKELTGRQTQLDDANAQIIDLQGTKAKLADKVNRLQIETENKFAGIALTGKRVVFLVDMSGSMDRTDIDTVAPEKWPLVRETLLKVMRSLPDLEKFQVILFSNRLTYLIGKPGQWLDYNKEASIEEVRKAMATTRPSGDTNMYIAFEEIFHYREKGLDTVYLFSDGLPNSGPGLTTAQENTLKEVERSELLSKHIRRLLNTNWNKPDPRLARVRINSVGFFYEEPNVGAFLWALSRENDGSFVGMSKP
jgi:predicted  nucleic acid-binding Zn-ribbon protein